MIRRAGLFFDSWVQRGGFRATDLGLYRIIYAIFVVLKFPDFEWVTEYPDSLYVPPPGPLQLVSGLPSHGFMVAVEIALALALVALAAGLHTTIASFAVTGLLLVGFGFSYSVGKIDHNILLVLVPSVLAFAGWGRTYSVDAVRSHRSAGAIDTPQWPLRFLGLLIGLAFVTAAFPKVRNGWLSPDTQAQCHVA